MSGLTELALCLASHLPRSPLHSSLNHSVSRRLLPGRATLTRTSRPPNIQYYFCVLIPHPQERYYNYIIFLSPRNYHPVLVKWSYYLRNLLWWKCHPLSFFSLFYQQRVITRTASNFWLRILKQNLPLLLFCSNINMADAIEIKETKADADPGAPSIF